MASLLLYLRSLPLSFRCFVPGMAFSQLSADESMLVLHNLTTLCVDLDPQVSSFALLFNNITSREEAVSRFCQGSISEW